MTITIELDKEELDLILSTLEQKVSLYTEIVDVAAKEQKEDFHKEVAIISRIATKVRKLLS